MTQPLSACIICKNEIQRIGYALDSLAWCDDIVVVDSGSTDGTLDFARNHPAEPRVLHHDWAGYNAQREYAVSQCRHDWVLMLDADEECDPALAAEIQSLDLSPAGPHKDVALFRMPRRNYMAGRYVRCWSPDYQTRLAHRGRVVWDKQALPEVRRPGPGFRQATLRQPLLHNRHGDFTMTDLVDGKAMEHYANLLAESMHNRGKRASLLNLLFRPVTTFIKYYLLRGAFLDGRFGLVIAWKTTVGVVLKYSALYAREELVGKGTKAHRH